MFPRRFVGNEYFVTMRVWDLLVWCIWSWIWDSGCFIVARCGGTRCGRLDGGLGMGGRCGAYCVWVRL